MLLYKNVELIYACIRLIIIYVYILVTYNVKYHSNDLYFMEKSPILIASLPTKISKMLRFDSNLLCNSSSTS